MLLTVFAVAAAVQIAAWALLFPRAWSAATARARGNGRPSEPVSVIVCFRNEENSLTACLRALLTQDHSDFEVLAVDDNSTDGSAALVHQLATQHPNLRCLHPGPTRPGKKDALTYGINQADHDLLLLTDADCVPASSEWLGLMTAPLHGEAEVVLGFSPYRNDNTLLSTWQRFEAVYVATKYLAFARAGWPYMGVGRNLAYRKSFFIRADGFRAHADLAGGDDDLLIGNHALPGKTIVVTEPSAWVWSEPHASWRAYWRQRRRHQRVGGRYPQRYAIALGTLALSHGLFFLLGFTLLFTEAAWWAMGAYWLRIVFVFRTYCEPFWGAAAGAGERPNERVKTLVDLLLCDALLGPMYLWLAFSPLAPRREW